MKRKAYGRFSTNPKRSSQQQALESKKSKKKLKGMNNAESVEKINKSIDKLLVQKALGNPQETHNNPQPVRKPCTRQVYSEWEVAENMAQKLKAMGIDAQVQRCTICGLVHISEIRLKP